MKAITTLGILAATVVLTASCGGGGGGSSSTSALPNFVSASLIADVNGDGHNDIVLGFQDTSVDSDMALINSGDGKTYTKRNLPPHYNGVNGATVALAGADVNGDGNMDVLAVTVDVSSTNFYGNSKLELYLGNGDGTFTDASSNIASNTFTGWPEWIRTGDFDKDGHVDFVLTASSSVGTISGTFYLNDGTGHFAPATSISLTDSMTSTASSQLTWASDGEVNASGSFSSFPADLLVGDLDQDGDPDLFAPSDASGAMAAFINVSTPGHLAFNIRYTVNSSAPYGGTNPDPFKNGALLDINGDGYPDVVGSSAISGSTATVPLHAYLNNGTGVFTQDDSVFTPSQPGVVHARQWLVADLNSDGRDDLLVADHGYDSGTFPGHSNLLLYNNGSSQLSNVTAADLSTASGYTHGASIGDLDGDGYPDIFLNNGYTSGSTMTFDNEPRLWFNNGSGVFTQQVLTVI